MATERLSLAALRHHDHILSLQAQQETVPQARKQSLAPMNVQTRLYNRRESDRRVSTTRSEPATITNQIERKSSRQFLAAPSRPPVALSLFRVIQAARTWKQFSRRRHTTPQKPAVPQFENTYSLGPDPGKVFRPDKVQPVIEEVLRRRLKDCGYSPDSCRQSCLQISSEILSEVKHMGLQRYKVVCQVIIMQNKGQGSEVASRGVWDSLTDSSASFTLTLTGVACVASVHAVYFE